MTIYDTMERDAYEYKRNNKRNKIKETLAACFLGLVMFVALPAIAETITNTTVNANETVTTETEQKYIVRICHAYKIDEDTGITSYLDNDGNVWDAIDAPTEIGYDARILFDSKETKDVSDDEIIDITEWN